MIAALFSLNNQTLINAPPDVVIDSNTVSIYNWSAVPLYLCTQNIIQCREKDIGFTRTTNFFSLSKLLVTLIQYVRSSEADYNFSG